MKSKVDMQVTASQSSSSSLLVDEFCACDRANTVLSRYTSRLHHQHSVHLPSVTVLVLSLNRCNICQSRKTCSVDVSLLSYSFLIRLINRLFHLHSNFTITAAHHSIITDDFDLDNYLITVNQDCPPEFSQYPIREFIVHQYDVDDWCIIEDDQDGNFDTIELEQDVIVVTVKPMLMRQETFLQKATSWLHGSVHSTLTKCVTKKEFRQMFDASTGRLLNEQTFRQRIFECGCEPSIRRIVWCYLFRIFDQSMSDDDRIQYGIKAKERYAEMKQAWQMRHESDIDLLENLIQKDVTRTDSSVKFFENRRTLSREKLLHILMTYCVYHPEPGYAQGMTDMAAPILYVIRDEALAYACFCSLMRYMSPLFRSDGLAINRRLDLLRKTLRAIDVDLWTKIEQCDIGNLMFAYRWVLLDCKREFPFKDIFNVFETLWASIATDRFELSNSSSSSDLDDLCPSSVCPHHRHASMVSSITNTILSLRSSSPLAEDMVSDQSSVDEDDSGYPDSPNSPMFEHQSAHISDASVSSTAPIPLEPWLKAFSAIDNDQTFSDMFTIFLCVGLLEQNRASIMQVSTMNVDNDDYIGFYFTRLVRQNDARQALQLARHYYRQYVLFQMRLKQLSCFDH